METCAKSHPQLFEHPACHLAALEALEVPQKTLQSHNEMKGQICEERMNTINLNSPYCELKYSHIARTDCVRYVATRSGKSASERRKASNWPGQKVDRFFEGKSVSWFKET